MSEPPQDRPNLFFRLVLILGAAFVITIFGQMAALFAEPESPLAQLFDRHGTTLILSQVVLLLVVGFLALAVDRRRTLAQQRQQQARTEPDRPADRGQTDDAPSDQADNVPPSAG